MISNSRHANALFLQFIGIGILGLKLLGLISPANAISIIDSLGATFFFASLVTLILLFRLFFDLGIGSMAKFTCLCLAVVGVYQVFSDSGVIPWYMLSFLLLLNLIFYLELVSVEYLAFIKVPVLLLNSFAIIYLFIDYRIYLITKTHISYKLVLELAQVFELVVDSSRHTGQKALMVVLECGIFCLFPFAGFVNADRNSFSRSMKKGFALISGILLLINLGVFTHICRNVPLVYFLPIRLELGNLPVPVHPAMANDKVLAKVLSQKIKVNEGRIYPSLSFVKKRDFKEKNIVFIVLESLRRKEFNRFMPFTGELAKDGLLMNSHYSTSNISASSFHSIFRSSFPVNLTFQNPAVSNKIVFEDFLQANGYETILLKASGYSAFPERMSWGKKSIELDIPDKAKNPAVLLNETLRFLCAPGKKAIFVYLFNTHFNYYYPPEFEIHKPVLSENENLFLISPDALTLTKVENRYKNAVTYTDSVLAGFFKQAKENGIFESTVFVLFGDHGESLGESGFFAHATGPHRSQFEVPLLFVGGNVAKKEVHFPTSHSDLLPILCEQMDIQVNGGWGSNLSAPREFPLLQIDESVTGRIIVRYKKFMSIFDLDLNGNLKWLATVSNDFTIDESVAELYLGKNFLKLKAQIECDIAFIKRSIE